MYCLAIQKWTESHSFRTSRLLDDGADGLVCRAVRSWGRDTNSPRGRGRCATLSPATTLPVAPRGRGEMRDLFASDARPRCKAVGDAPPLREAVGDTRPLHEAVGDARPRLEATDGARSHREVIAAASRLVAKL